MIGLITDKTEDRIRMKKTNRGFNIYSEFSDTRDNRIIIQESSDAMKHCCWIFVKDSEGREVYEHLGKIYAHSPHLSKAQAKRLAKALLKFAES